MAAAVQLVELQAVEAVRPTVLPAVELLAVEAQQQRRALLVARPLPACSRPRRRRSHRRRLGSHLSPPWLAELCISSTGFHAKRSGACGHARGLKHGTAVLIQQEQAPGRIFLVVHLCIFFFISGLVMEVRLDFCGVMATCIASRVPGRI